MLVLLAPAALAGVLVALWQGLETTRAIQLGLSTALAAFGGWAMAREFAPDDQAATIIALVLAVTVNLAMGDTGGLYHLLLLFTVLALTRVVNRTTGLEARLSDSVILLALTLWVVYGTANPLFAAVAGLAFALDGLLDPAPLRRQWLFALLSFGAVIVYMVDYDVGPEVYTVPATLSQWLAILTALMFALNIFLLRKVSSRCDVGRKPMSPSRVRGGMWVALLAIMQGVPEVGEIALIAAAALGVCISGAIHRSFRNPA